MYNFNQDVNTGQDDGPRFGVFASDVKTKRMTPKDGQTLFKLLPAHDAATAEVVDGATKVDPVAYVQFRDLDGNLTAWGRMVQTAQFVGHGPMGKGGNRKEFVSLKSYSDGTGEVFCPVSQLLETIRREPQWQYLTKDSYAADGQTILDRKAISRNMSKQLLCNVIDVKDVQAGVQLGIFSKSAFDSLLGKNGLACQVNVSATPEMIAQNPMMRWACGDMTDPVNGPVLLVHKDPNPKSGFQYVGYVVEYAMDTAGGQLLRMPVDMSGLQARYNLLDLESIIPKPTEESLVMGLVEVLNAMSPTGIHEYELLRHTFGASYKIPDPPAAGYAPGLGAAPQAPQAAPAAVMGAAAPPVSNALPTSVPAAAPAPAAAFAPPAATAAATAAVAAPAPAAAAAVAAVPGDAAPTFNRDAFLTKLAGDKAPAAAPSAPPPATQ